MSGGCPETLSGVDQKVLDALAETNPVVRILPDRAGNPRAAVGLLRVRAPVDVLWQTVRDLERLPAFIPMIESMRRLPPGPGGQELMRVNLRFKIAIFAAHFHLVVRLDREEGRMVDLAYHGGKVREVHIRFELAPLPGGDSVLLCRVGFDPTSLGWLVNIFIRHHPEIEWGIHAGSVASIADAVRRLAESGR